MKSINLLKLEEDSEDRYLLENNREYKLFREFLEKENSAKSNKMLSKLDSLNHIDSIEYNVLKQHLLFKLYLQIF